jgi:hypothetical protein
MKSQFTPREITELFNNPVLETLDKKRLALEHELTTARAELWNTAGDVDFAQKEQRIIEIEKELQQVREEMRIQQKRFRTEK